MKVAGLAEVESALARVRKVHALGRIHSRDKDYIELHLLQVKHRVEKMAEKDEDGEVIPNGPEASNG